MKMKIVLTLLTIAILLSPVSASFSAAFSPNDTVHYNVSYANAPANAVPIALPIFLAILGIVFLLLSFAIQPSQGQDVIAWMTPIPLLISAWRFLNIDIVTGYGTTIAETTTTNFTSSLLESHMIYAMYPESVFIFILFIISLLNIYRVTASPRFDNSEYEE